MPRCEMCDEWPDCPWKTDPEIMCSEYHPKPITNAERIRAMSDEELATFLFNNVDCSHCTMQGGGCSIDCEKWMLSWLKAPAEQEAKE